MTAKRPSSSTSAASTAEGQEGSASSAGGSGQAASQEQGAAAGGVQTPVAALAAALTDKGRGASPDVSSGWSMATEMAFHQALLYNGQYRPAGLGKHFHMAALLDSMAQRGHRVEADSAWEFMEEFFDVNALDGLHHPELATEGSTGQDGSSEDQRAEETPFVEFSLPARGFRNAIAEMKTRARRSSESGSSSLSAGAKDPMNASNKVADVDEEEETETNTPKPSSGAGSAKRNTRGTPGASGSGTKRRK